jgi:PhnB protein
MATVNPYITYKGNCEEAFKHYKSIFGGEFTMLNRFSEMPPQDGMEIPAADLDKIMHVELRISDETILMGSDTGGEWAPKTVVGNNITLSISSDTKEQADHFFNSLSERGKIIMPMDKTFWGSYFGMCTDKFDINWMVSFGKASEG